MRQYKNDSERITAFHNGERTAENDIFEQYFRPMCLVASRFTTNSGAAEDIVAEAFVKAFAKRKEFATLGNLKAFLYISVRNASYNLVAAEKRHQAVHEQILTAQALETAPGPLQLEVMEAELLAGIYKEIEQLPGRCREIFKMLYFDEMSPAEIAALLNINVQTVHSQKARAIQLLKIAFLQNNRLDSWIMLLALLGGKLAEA